MLFDLALQSAKATVSVAAARRVWRRALAM